MGVDLTLEILCRGIAGPHLAAQVHCFSNGNPHILALLMGVDLTVKTFAARLPDLLWQLRFIASHKEIQTSWLS